VHGLSGQARRSTQAHALPLALAAGALLLLPESEPLLAASAFVALLGLSEALARTEGRPWRAALCGLAFGTAANAVALWSLIALLMRFAQLSAALALLVALLAWTAQGLPYGLAALACELSVRRGLPRWLSLPLTLTFVLAWVPQLFPWQVGTTQLAFLPFVQVAELGGSALVSFFLVLSAAATHALLHTRKRRTWTAMVALGALLAPCGYGMWRIEDVTRQRSGAPRLALGVVQGNVGVDRKHDERQARAILADLRTLTRELEQRGAELTLWGETAYPYPWLRDARAAPLDLRGPLADGVRGPLLLGLETYANVDEGAARYNSAWLVGADGMLGDRVDKARLLAFGEYVPLWHELAWLRKRYPRRGFSPGRVDVVRTHWGKIGVLICYEDLFAVSARRAVELGARVLVNLTNDGWFGPGREPALHDLAARMRAIEQRRDLVRTVNTGISSFTSAIGVPLVRTRPFTRTAFVAEVRLLDGQTPYARFGDWVAPACALAWCGALLGRARRA